MMPRYVILVFCERLSSRLRSGAIRHGFKNANSISKASPPNTIKKRNKVLIISRNFVILYAIQDFFTLVFSLCGL